MLGRPRYISETRPSGPDIRNASPSDPVACLDFRMGLMGKTRSRALIPALPEAPASREQVCAQSCVTEKRNSKSALQHSASVKCCEAPYDQVKIRTTWHACADLRMVMQKGSAFSWRSGALGKASGQSRCESTRWGDGSFPFSGRSGEGRDPSAADPRSCKEVQ